MRMHTIQTGTRRRLNTLVDKTWTEPLPIYAWVIEHPEGIIVVDTGEIARVAEPGYFPWWHPYFRLGVRSWVRPEEEIGPQLQALGIQPTDVRWLVMTHVHTVPTIYLPSHDPEGVTRLTNRSVAPVPSAMISVIDR